MSANITVRLVGDTKVSAHYLPPQTIELEHSPDLTTDATVWVRFDTGNDVSLKLRGAPAELLAALTAAVAAVVASHDKARP